MNIVVIDNFDSFVYNIVQYVGEMGFDPIVYQNNASIKDIKRENPDKLIISPGPKRPEDSGVSKEVVKKIGKRIPTLGVCLGHQTIAYSYGATIKKADRLMHGKTSRISHNGNLIFEEVPNPFVATRYHSLIVENSSLPSSFKVIASCENNHDEIMGIKHEKYPLFGIQFHPESILTEFGKKIIRNFLKGEI